MDDERWIESSAPVELEGIVVVTRTGGGEQAIAVQVADAPLTVRRCAFVRLGARLEEGAAPFRVTGGEDAPFLMRRVQERGGQACYFIIGADLTDFHHTAHFDFDEASIATGVRMFAGLADTPLNEWRGPVRAGFGVHLVRVTERQEPELPEFAAVREQVLRDWLKAETERFDRLRLICSDNRY